MKKTILIFFLLLKCGTTFSQISAFQRIAIPATAFELSAIDIGRTVPSFCSDFNRAAPEIKATNFDFVHLDEKCVTIGSNPPISLQEAIDNKFIDLEVNGYKGVKFKNLKKTNESIKISIKKDVVIGDVKNDNKGIILGDGIKHTDDQFEQERLQHEFWEQQSLTKSLTELDYLKEEDINNAIKFKEAVKKFQTDNNLKADGTLGPNTNENLYANSSIKKYLPKEDHGLNTTETIKKFQKTYSLLETGVFDIETKIQLIKLESINNKINSHDPLFNFYKNKEEGEVLQRVSKILSQKTIFSTEKDISIVITPTEDGYQFLKVKRNDWNDGFLIAESRQLTKSEIPIFDLQYEKQASSLTTTEVEIIHFGAMDNGSMQIQIGKSNETISVLANSPNLEGEILEKIFEKISQQSKTNNIVVTRDNFVKTLANNSSNSFWAANDFYTFNSSRVNPQKIIENLRLKFPNKKFYLGGELEKDLLSIKQMPKVNSTSDVTAITAPKSLEVNYDLLSKDNVKNTFIQNNINVIDLDNPFLSTSDAGSNVILITGNKDANFEKYLGQLLRTVDVKDKVIVTFSCFKEGNDFTNSFIIKNFKANSIIYFPTKIHPDGAKKVLLKFSELVNYNPNGKTVRELMEQSIEETYTIETNEFLKTEISKLRQFIQQTSFNYNMKEENTTFKS